MRRRLWKMGVFLIGYLAWGTGWNWSQSPCLDRDRDGFLDQEGCGTQVDCNDLDPQINPIASELCNGIDDDCDGIQDEGCNGICANPEPRWYESLKIAGSAEHSATAPSLARSRHGYGVAWLQPSAPGSACSETRFSRLNETGKTQAGPAILKSAPWVLDALEQLRVVWAGSRFSAAWTENDTPDCQDAGPWWPRLNQLAANGRFLSPALPLSCDWGGVNDLAWTGRQTVVLWAQGYGAVPGDQGLFLARLTPEGELISPCGYQFLSEVRTGVRLGWNGRELGVLYHEGFPDGAWNNSDLVFGTLTQDFSWSNDLRRKTFSPRRSVGPSLAWGDGEWGISWTEEFVDGYQEIAFMRLTRQGVPINPPGVVQVTWGANLPGGYPRGNSRIVWTGQEYGIFFHGQTDFSGAGDIYFIRVSRTGKVQGAPVLLTRDNEKQALLFDVAWNGLDFTVVWDNRASAQKGIFFTRMGCNCGDQDGDRYSSCLAGDCDDTNPAIHPGAQEICGDGEDNDCDGLVDCLDSVGCPRSGPAPGEVTGVRILSDTTTLAWDPAAGAERYDVARGFMSDLSFEEGPDSGRCFAAGVTATFSADQDRPGLGDGFYYLVRGRAGSAAQCRLGTWGNPSRDSRLQACP